MKVLLARKLMVDWPNGWCPASDFASVRFKRRGWVDFEGAHPAVYEMGMRDRECGDEGQAGTGPP